MDWATMSSEGEKSAGVCLVQRTTAGFRMGGGGHVRRSQSLLGHEPEKESKDEAGSKDRRRIKG